MLTPRRNLKIVASVLNLTNSRNNQTGKLTPHPVFRVNTADPVHFTLTPPECHMEIRNGYGTSGTRVAGPVHVGDPLTLLINMRSQFGRKSLVL